MARIVCLLGSLALAVSSLSASAPPIYHVHNVRRHYTSDAPTGFENAMNSTMTLSFETRDLSFSLDLELNTKIYGKHTKVYMPDENGNAVLQPRRYRSFTGKGRVSGKHTETAEEDSGDCAVTFYDDLRFHCTCFTSDNIYTIDWKELQEREEGISSDSFIGKNDNSGMVLVSSNEVIETRKQNNVKEGKNKRKRIRTRHSGNKRDTFSHEYSDSSKHIKASTFSRIDNLKSKQAGSGSFGSGGSSRSLLDTNDQSYLEPFTDCYDNQYDYTRQIYIGIIADDTWVTLYGSSSAALTGVESLFNTADGANIIYYYQLNIMLTMGTVYIGTSNTNDGSSYTYDISALSSSYDISTRLNYFNTWRTEYYNQHKDSETNGIWHLMTNCHPSPGTVGLAWLGVLCSYAYGTGVSNYINPATSYYGTGTWQVFAHEVGHNFDGGHTFDEGQGTTGGIMDYGNGLYPVSGGAYQFHPTYNQDEVCTEVSNSMTGTNRWSNIDVDKCWHSYDGGSTAATPSPVASNTPGPTSRPTSKPTDKPTDKPTSRPTESPVSSSGSSYCGDGVVSGDEVCDTAASDGDCCESDCSAYITDTSGCFMADDVVDAVFKDDDGYTYVFQGSYYARYTTYYWGWNNNNEDSGYPKSIATSFPISSFSEDITAIAYVSDSEVYVFKDMEYTKIDMNSGEYSGYPRTFSDDFKMPSAITSCGTIDAAYYYSSSYYGTMFVVACGTTLGFANAQYTFSSTYQTTDFGIDSDQEWAALSNTYGSNSFSYYTKDATRRRRLMVGVSDEVLRNKEERRRLATELDDSSDCPDRNCESCSSDNTNICYTCYDNYVLYGSVKCLSNYTLLYLDFDIYSPYTIDHYFVEGGRDTLEDYTYVEGVTGDNSTAMWFDGTTKLPLEPLDYDSDNQYVESFRISFRFKPTSINYDKLMSIDNDLVSIYLSNGTNGTYVSLFTVGNVTYQSTFEGGLLIDSWNVVELEYSDDTYKVYINGDTISTAYASSGDTDDETGDWAGIFVELEFNEWYLGSSENSVHGALDQVTFKVITTTSYSDSELNSETSIIYNTIDNSKYHTWLIVACVFILLTVLFGCALGYFIHKYCQAKNASGGDTGDMGYFQMKS